MSASPASNVVVFAPRDPRAARGFEPVARDLSARLRFASSLEDLERHLRRTPMDCMVVHRLSPGRDGMTVERLAERAAGVRVIATVEPHDARAVGLAELVRRRLIHDFHTLPIDPVRLGHAIGHAAGLTRLERLAGGPIASGAADEPEPFMIGNSPAMERVFALIRKFALTDAPVLITGESGTGKELAARAIFERSGRAARPFVAVNCAAIPPTLIASELFGHEKGAFTDARERRIGKLEAAHGGTLFLDEIGDLPPELQGHLLRFLQEGTIERVGSNKTIKLDVRLISATNVDLRAAVAAGAFRQDLYYRLAVLPLHMPALRERDRDVATLAHFFLHQFAREIGRAELRFEPEAERAIRAYPWPGNVRELISAVRMAAVIADGAVVRKPDLGLDDATGHAERLGDGHDAIGARGTLDEVRARAERAALLDALKRNGECVQRAARDLAVSRMTVYRLLERHGIHAPRNSDAACSSGDAPIT